MGMWRFSGSRAQVRIWNFDITITYYRVCVCVLCVYAIFGLAARFNNMNMSLTKHGFKLSMTLTMAGKDEPYHRHRVCSLSLSCTWSDVIVTNNL